MHDRNDLVENKAIDAAVSYADGMTSGIDNKNFFENSVQHYVEALRIRNDAIAEASGLEPGDTLDQGDHEHAGSLFFTCIHEVILLPLNN